MPAGDLGALWLLKQVSVENLCLTSSKNIEIQQKPDVLNRL